MSKLAFIGIGLFLGVVLCFIVLWLWSRTRPNAHSQAIPDLAYNQALEVTGAGSVGQFELKNHPGVSRVLELFENYTASNLRKNISVVYANEFYFRDAFCSLKNRDDLLSYFIEGLEPLRDCEFIFTDVAESNGNFYLRWTMRLRFKSQAEDAIEESIGMTHMRFDESGRVIFHQDYWDPSDVLYAKIPVAAQMIALVKGRFLPKTEP